MNTQDKIIQHKLGVLNLAFAIAQPTYGQVRASNELKQNNTLWTSEGEVIRHLITEY